MGECNRGSETEPTNRELSETLFLLKRATPNNGVAIEVDFSFLGADASLNSASKNAIPNFNTDGHYFTPSFLLRVDQVQI
jgi:hypothetical protein